MLSLDVWDFSKRSGVAGSSHISANIFHKKQKSVHATRASSDHFPATTAPGYLTIFFIIIISLWKKSCWMCFFLVYMEGPPLNGTTNVQHAKRLPRFGGLSLLESAHWRVWVISHQGLLQKVTASLNAIICCRQITLTWSPLAPPSAASQDNEMRPDEGNGDGGEQEDGEGDSDGWRRGWPSLISEATFHNRWAGHLKGRETSLTTLWAPSGGSLEKTAGG